MANPEFRQAFAVENVPTPQAPYGISKLEAEQADKHFKSGWYGGGDYSASSGLGPGKGQFFGYDALCKKVYLCLWEQFTTV